MKKWQIGCCLGCLTPFVLLFSGLVVWSIQGKVMDARNRPIIIEQSALYIYNHYDGVERIEYSNFSAQSFGLGSHTYAVDIMVNDKHEFRLNHFFHHDMEDPDFEFKAYEITENVVHLLEKSPSGNLTQLPESLELIDRTKP